MELPPGPTFEPPAHGPPFLLALVGLVLTGAVVAQTLFVETSGRWWIGTFIAAVLCTGWAVLYALPKQQNKSLAMAGFAGGVLLVCAVLEFWP